MPANKEIDAVDFNARMIPSVAYTDPALIEELNRMAIHADLSYEHDWQIHQLIVWDNRCLIHKATPYDPHTQSRVIRRCTVLGEVPV